MSDKKEEDIVEGFAFSRKSLETLKNLGKEKQEKLIVPDLKTDPRMGYTLGQPFFLFVSFRALSAADNKGNRSEHFGDTIVGGLPHMPGNPNDFAQIKEALKRMLAEQGNFQAEYVSIVTFQKVG